MCLDPLYDVGEVLLDARAGQILRDVLPLALFLQQRLRIVDDILEFLERRFVRDGNLGLGGLDRLQGGHDGLEAVPQALGLSFILHDVSSGLEGRADERDDGVDDHDGAISLWEEGWEVGRSSCADPAQVNQFPCTPRS